MCRPISHLPLPSVHHDPVDSQVAAGEAAIFLAPQNSNSAVLAPAVSCETTNTILVSPPLPEVKSRLLLPKTEEGWEEANDHFHNILVPAVLSAHSLPEKYTTLTDGTYSYFQSSCGTKSARR